MSKPKTCWRCAYMQQNRNALACPVGYPTEFNKATGYIRPLINCVKPATNKEAKKFFVKSGCLGKIPVDSIG